MNEDKINIEDVEAPTHLDGSPVDNEEAARAHAGLVSGEIEIVMVDGVEDELEAMGLSPEDIRAMLITSTRKTMS